MARKKKARQPPAELALSCEQALYEHQHGSASSALDYYTECSLKISPTHPLYRSGDLYSNLGSMYELRGEYSAALSYLQIAVAMAPGHALAHHNRGNALRGQAAVRLEPTSVFHPAADTRPPPRCMQARAARGGGGGLPALARRGVRPSLPRIDLPTTHKDARWLWCPCGLFHESLPPLPGPSGEQLAAQRLRTRGSLGDVLRQAPEYTERAVETIAAYERAVAIAPREVRPGPQRVAVAASGAVASEASAAHLNLHSGDAALAAGNVSAAQAVFETALLTLTLTLTLPLTLTLTLTLTRWARPTARPTPRTRSPRR